MANLGINKTTFITAAVTIGILWAIKKYAPNQYPL